MAVDIDSLQIEIEATSSDAAAKIDALATALTNLKAAAKGGAGLTTVSKQMQALASAAASLNNTGIGKLRKIAPALNALSSVQKSSGLSSTVNALSKLSSVSESLKGNSIKEFASQMNQVASAMRPLATEMQKVSNGFSAFPIRIQKIIQSNTGLSASNNKAAKSFGVLGTRISSTTAKLGIYYLAFQRVANMASDWIKSANDYIENVNLFQVSMGEFYDEAFAYAELLNDRLGIDPSEWMRAQGVFMSMANGFGLARQQAYDLSEGLTELAYDLSSLYNEDVSESILRLQSALSGEIEPIRRLGISISQATLQEYALAHGIDESVISMTEQEKALLRSLVLMEGAGRIGAIGDFAKTLESPANALRVLRQQITQLGRAIGTALLPIIIQIIPWVQAFVEVLTDAIRALATFLGFTMPEWETSDWATGITDGASDAEDAIGGATSAAKEMKKALLGIDELTILEPSNAGGSGGVSGGSGWASNLEIPNIWDKNAINEIQTKADEYKEKIKEILKVVLAVGAAFAAWKISTGLANGIIGIQAGVGAIQKAISALVGFGPVQSLLSWVSGALAAMTIQFNAAGGGIAGFLSVAKLIASTMAPAVTVFTVIISTIKVLVERWNDIKEAIKSVLIDLGIEDRLNDLALNLDRLGEKIGWVNGFWNGLKDTIGSLMDLIGGTVITLVGSTLVGAFNGLIEVLNGLIGIVTGVIDTLSGLANFIIGVFTGDLQKAEAGINMIGNGIQEVFGGLWNSVVGGVTQFVNGVINAISELGGTLLTKQIPQILQGFKEWWGDVVSYFTEALPKWWNETISPWFTVEKWKQLGNRALEGLFGGLSNIGNKIRTWGGNLIAGVKNFFGIHSPSRLFRDEIGLNLGLGISEGIGDSEKTILSEITRAGSMMQSALTISDMPNTFSVEQATRNIQEITGSVAVRNDSSDTDNGSMNVVNAIYAMAQQIIAAIEENGGDVYLDGDKVGKQVTAYQNRQNRMYGKTLQRI